VDKKFISQEFQLKIFLKIFFGLVTVLAVFIFISKSEYFKDASYFERVTTSELHFNNGAMTPKLARYIEEDKIPINCLVLMLALEYKNNELAKHLIDKGVDVNSTNCTVDFGSLPVGFSVFKPQGTPDMEMLEYLINEGGFDLSSNSASNGNLFHMLIAIYFSYSGISEEILKSIIEISKKYNADINHEDENGITPIMMFINFPEFVKIMQKEGADIHYKNKNDETILNQLIKYDSWKSLSIIREHKVKAYINGFIIDAIEVSGTYEREILLKRIKEAPEIVKRWQQNIKGNNLQLDCKFAVKGGDNTSKNSVTTDKKTEHLTMFKHMNAYVFGGCSKEGFYHYQVQDKKGRTYHTEYNLHWSDNKEPIKNEKGGYHAVGFNKKFDAEIIWYRTGEMTHDWQHTIGKTKPIRKQKITVL